MTSWESLLRASVLYIAFALAKSLSPPSDVARLDGSDVTQISLEGPAATLASSFLEESVSSGSHETFFDVIANAAAGNHKRKVNNESQPTNAAKAVSVGADGSLRAPLHSGNSERRQRLLRQADQSYEKRSTEFVNDTDAFAELQGDPPTTRLRLLKPGEFRSIGDFREGRGEWHFQGKADINECKSSSDAALQAGGTCAFVKFTPDCSEFLSEGAISRKIETTPGAKYYLQFHAAFTYNWDSVGSSLLYVMVDESPMRLVVTSQYRDNLAREHPKQWTMLSVPFTAENYVTKLELREMTGRQCLVVKDFVIKRAEDRVVDYKNGWKDPKLMMLTLQRIGCPNKDPRDIREETWEKWKSNGEDHALTQMWQLCDSLRMGYSNPQQDVECCGRNGRRCVPKTCQPVHRFEFFQGERMGSSTMWLDVKDAEATQKSTKAGAAGENWHARNAIDGNGLTCTKTDGETPGPAWRALKLGTDWDIRSIRLTSP